MSANKKSTTKRTHNTDNHQHNTEHKEHEGHKHNTTHAHSHSHSSSCAHHHGGNLTGKKLLWVTLLNFSITIVQIIGGLLSNSLALLSDALHNLGDSSALLIAYIANKLSSKPADIKSTFGYKRIEILAALFNAVVLIAICIFLFFEAFERFMNPEPIKGALMITVACFGLLANLISVIILSKDKNQSLNIRAAYLHLLGDTISSVAVIVGGIFIWLYNVTWIDPLITVVLGVYIIKHTWSILKETIDILMQFTPHNIDITEIKQFVEEIEEVNNIHHVHIWQLTDSRIHFEAHIEIKEDIKISNTNNITTFITKELKDKFNITHVTIQYGYKCCANKELINQL